MKLRYLLAASIAMLAVGITAAQGGAPPLVTTASVFSLPGGTTVAGASSTLVRHEDGVSFQLNTSGLLPGHAITLWLVIFNHPAGCVHPYACQPYVDFTVAAGTSIIWGAGRVIGGDGTANYAGHIAVGDLNRPSALPSNLQSVLGNGLTNALGAHFLLVVHDHGVTQPGEIDQQIHSFGVGCPGDDGNNCTDRQASYNKP
jgi:hypothetical protein